MSAVRGSKLRVALDTAPLYTSRAGVARYVQGLLAGMGKVRPRDVAIYEFAWPVSSYDYHQPARALKTLYRELVWPNLQGRRRLQGGEFDVLHTTSAIQFAGAGRVGRVHTLYDLAALLDGSRFRRWTGYSWRRSLEAARSADVVLCISQFTADQAMHHLGIPSRRLRVTYLGNSIGDAAVTGAGLPSDVPSGIPDKFFLFVGSLEPGKNLRLLREAYLMAVSRGVRLLPLVIVGARWEGVDGEGEPPDSWQYLGRQSDAVLAVLYKKASALVFPSKYEGFGLPIVEAMSLGCPVVCSAVASIPEVAGDAALYAELTAQSYLSAMVQLQSDESLRGELKAMGREQSARFSWELCAAETLEAYESLLG